MKTKKWTEVLFKSSAQKPSTIETTCLDTVIPPYPQCSPTRPISASTPAKKKSIFNFGSRNSSTHSLLNLAFNSSTDNISPKISRINITNNNTRTSRKTKLDAASGASMANEVSIETTTIYYHPPEPVTQTPVYAGQPQLIKNEQHYARGSSRNGYRNNAASSDQLTHIRDSDPSIRRSISYNSLSLHDHIHRPNYPNSSKERLPTPTAVLAARRKRAGSSPSTSVSNSATTLNTAYWQPPKLRPHEIASLPEQYVQYLQQQQQYGRFHQTPPVPIPSRDSRDSLRRHSSDTIMKLQASVRNMAQSRPSLEHEAVPFRQRSMTTDLLCPHNTPVVSGTIPILYGSSLQSADSNGGECSEMSYDELLRVVENLSGTVEVLSRKIGTMMNGSDIAYDWQLSMRDNTSPVASNHCSNSPVCFYPVSLAPPLSPYTVRSIHGFPFTPPSRQASSILSSPQVSSANTVHPPLPTATATTTTTTITTTTAAAATTISTGAPPPLAWRTETRRQATTFTINNKPNNNTSRNNIASSTAHSHSPSSFVPIPFSSSNTHISSRELSATSYSPISSALFLSTSQPLPPPPYPTLPSPPRPLTNVIASSSNNNSCNNNSNNHINNKAQVRGKARTSTAAIRADNKASRQELRHRRRASKSVFPITAPNRRHTIHGSRFSLAKAIRRSSRRRLLRALTMPHERSSVTSGTVNATDTSTTSAESCKKSCVLNASSTAQSTRTSSLASSISSSPVSSEVSNTTLFDLAASLPPLESSRCRRERYFGHPPAQPPPPLPPMRPVRPSEDLCHILSMIDARLAERPMPQVVGTSNATHGKGSIEMKTGEKSLLNMSPAERRHTLRTCIDDDLQAMVGQLQSELQETLEHHQQQQQQQQEHLKQLEKQQTLKHFQLHPPQRPQLLQPQHCQPRSQLYKQSNAIAMDSIAEVAEGLESRTQEVTDTCFSKGNNGYGIISSAGNNMDVTSHLVSEGSRDEKQMLLRDCSVETQQLMSELAELRGLIMQWRDKNMI